MAEVMNEFSGSNGEVDDEHDSIKLNGDACDDASSIAANSPSDQIFDDESIPSKDDKCISSNYKSKIDGINNDKNTIHDTDGVQVHLEQQNNGNAAVANGRLQLDASSYAEDDEDDDDNDIESIQNDKCDKSRSPTSASVNVTSKKPIPDLTSINSVTKNSDSINDCDPLSMSVDGDSNCDSDKAESRRQSNSKDNEVAILTIDDVSTSSASVSIDDSITINNRQSSLTITAISENGAKDDDVVATDLSKRPHDGGDKRLNSTGGDEDDEANEDDEVISITSTPDKGGKKSSKKPSMSIVNITPRRSSRNINKQKSYAEKDAGDFENSNSDGISIVPTSGRKRGAGSSGTAGEDDEIEEITPTDPLADEPHRLSAVASGGKARGGNKTIVVSDTKGLVEFASNTKASRSNKKEPTLVIIDTNSILSGRGPIPVSQQGGSNSLLHSSATSAPIPVSLPIPAGAFANATRGNTSSSNAAFSVIPIGLPAQGIYSQFKNPPPQIKPIVVGPATTSVTPVSLVQSTTPSTLSATTISTAQSTPPASKQPPVILPSLTDDMFVVEAPSFIVPYVYEKPPMKSLKEHIEKIETDIKQQIAEEEARREQQERDEAKDSTAEKPAPSENEDKTVPSGDSAVKSDDKDTEEAAPKEDSTTADDSKRPEEKDAENQAIKEADKSGTSEEKKDAKESGDSSIERMEIDEEQPNTASKPPATVPTPVEPENSVKKMEIDTSPANAIKEIEKKITAGPTTGTDDPKKPASYFDNPLGKFFMQIGLNLVQEHVQTDLLRSQKRKRDKESGKCSADVQSTIDELTKTLESSKENNDPFKLELKKCELCSFKTESLLVMAHHLETPHMKNYTYRCNFCTLEVRSPHDILFHMEAEHNIRGRLERAPAFHQCPNCPFEDNQKGKLTRHLISCSKKYRPERNQEPPLDWEPPAKIPRVTRNRPPSMSPGNAVYQAAMSGLKQAPQNTLLPKLLPNTTNMKHNMMNAANKRPNLINQFVNRFPNAANAQPNFQQRPIPMQTPNQGMMFRPGGANSQAPVLLPQGYHLSGAQIYQTQNNKSQSSQPGLAAAKLLNQPSISITPLPRQTSASNNASNNSKSGASKSMNANMAASNKAGGGNFVVCEICDGYIKDLEQLRNHMQWIHKVKIHPKMIYNRPPLNCQKCQERFFTDQGLERHLLGAHGLVTSSMQEAANKGKDGGRCPVCGRVYQWKLLNHVARDHQMALKPAHLSYKCTVCTATFGMYKQFESHVYSAHSVVAKRAMDSSKKPPPAPSSSQNDALLKPLKINDEITIIPQPVRSTRPSNNSNKESNAATITKTVSNSKKMDCEDNNDHSSIKCDHGDDRMCKCACLMGNFANYEAFRMHLIGKHLKSFKIILSRLDLKSFNRIPNKENSFKLTKFDRNRISDEVRKQYNLDEFFIEIKRHRLSDDFKYKVVESKSPEPDSASSQPETENFVPEVVYSAVEDSDDGAKAKKKAARVFVMNTMYEKRKIECELFTESATRKKTAAAPKAAPASRKIVPKPGPAMVVNGGKQKKLISRGRRNAAKQSAWMTTDSTEIEASSSDEDMVNVVDDRRLPTAVYSRTTSGSNSFNEHFMSGLTAMISQHMVATTCRTTNMPTNSARMSTPRYRLLSQAGPFTVSNHQTVTMMSSASIGARGPRPVGLSTAASRFSAPNSMQIFSQRSIKVTKRVTTYSGTGGVASQRPRQPSPNPQTAKSKAAVPSKPEAVISLLSDSDSDCSAVEIVDSDPAASRKSDSNEDNEEVFILPS